MWSCSHSCFTVNGHLNKSSLVKIFLGIRILKVAKNIIDRSIRFIVVFANKYPPRIL